MALPDKLTDNLNELSSLWLAAKEAEKEATEDRRKIEDRIKSLVGFAENSEGTETVDPDQFTIKIVGRIDRKVDELLADGWPLKRIEAIMRAVLRAGAHELMHRPDTPVRVAISEYVDIASAFLDRDEVGMINAVLDRLAKEARAEELARPARS